MTVSSKTLVRAHQYLYYVLCRPVVSDYEYDRLCSCYGIDGGGGSDLASSYSMEEKVVATALLDGKPVDIAEVF